MGGDEPHTQRNLGQVESLVGLKQTGIVKPLEGFAPTPAEQPQSELGVNPAHYDLQPTERRIEVGLCSTANLDTLDQALLILGQITLDALEVATPDHCLELGQNIISLSLFNQLEVEMSPPAAAKSLHFPGQPDRR
jgi:hypothetical protein